MWYYVGYLIQSIWDSTGYFPLQSLGNDCDCSQVEMNMCPRSHLSGARFIVCTKQKHSAMI